MKPILFRGASVWDGSGAAAFPADVLVEGTRIKNIARAPEKLATDGVIVIEARGRSLYKDCSTTAALEHTLAADKASAAVPPKVRIGDDSLIEV